MGIRRHEMSDDAEALYQGLEALAKTVAEATLKAACITAAATMVAVGPNVERTAYEINDWARVLYGHATNRPWKQGEE